MRELDDELAAFMREAARQPFTYGEWDCAMTLANWVRAVTGEDPASDLRGSYGSEMSWKRLVAKAGSLDRLIDGIALKAGLKPTESPVVGDIAVVECAVIGTPKAVIAGAIGTPRGWAVKLNNGVACDLFPVVAAWGWER